MTRIKNSDGKIGAEKKFGAEKLDGRSVEAMCAITATQIISLCGGSSNAHLLGCNNPLLVGKGLFWWANASFGDKCRLFFSNIFLLTKSIYILFMATKLIHTNTERYTVCNSIII